MNVIYEKAALALASALGLATAWTIIPRLRPSWWLLAARWDTLVLWLATRLAPIWFIYVFSHYSPHSDVATCFWPQAQGALAGQIPYRDFESCFSPLFPSLLAIPLLAWPDPRVIFIWMSVLEAITIAATARAAGFDQPGVRRARFMACAFLAPGPLLLCVIGGQEDFLVWSFGLFTWLAATRHRDYRAGFRAAAGMLITKPLFILPLAGFLGLVRSRRAYLGVLVPVGVASAALLWHLTGRAFLMTLGQSHNISPPNLWIILHFLSAGRIPAGGPILSFSALAILLVGALFLGVRHAETLRASFADFAAGWTLLFALLMLLSPKSEGAYLANFALPCLAWLIDRPKWILLWTGLGAVGVVESSLFYRLGEICPADWAEVAGPAMAVDLVLQLLEVTALVAIAALAWRALSSPAVPHHAR